MDEQTASRTWRTSDVFWVLALYVAGVAAYLYLQAFLFGFASWDESRAVPALFVVEEIVDAGLLGLLPIYFVVRRYRAALVEIGLSAARLANHAFIGIVAGLLIYVVVTVVELFQQFFFDLSTSHPYLEMLEKADSSAVRMSILSSILFLAPVSEEVYFRGFAYTILKRNHGFWVALVISSTMFSVVHFNTVSFVPVLLTGIGLAVLFERTKSLIAPIVAHSLFNMLGVFL